MRSFDGDGIGGKFEFLVFGGLGIFLGDVLVFDHAAEDFVLAVDGEIGVVAKGGITSGSLGKAGKEGGFGKSEVGSRFVEIGFGGGFDSPSGAAVRNMI